MSDDNLYRELLLERLANPVNQGELKNADYETRLVNPLCGDEVLLQLKVKNGIVEQATYSGNGCAISQVGASFLAENIENKSLVEVGKIKENDILKMLGINPGPSRLKCALLSLNALKQALQND